MKRIILTFFFLIYSTITFGQEKIVYLDTNFLLSQSEVGKYVNSNLKKINDKNNEEFKKIEMNIKSSEEKLIKQKNILKKEDYENKISELRNKFKSYQEKKKVTNNDLNILRNNAGNAILENIKDVLTEYSKDNSISLVIQKQGIIIGKTELDVTNDILKLLNKKITKLELK